MPCEDIPKKNEDADGGVADEMVEEKKIQILSWRCQKFPSAINKDNNIRELFYRFWAARKFRIYTTRDDERKIPTNVTLPSGKWVLAMRYLLR